MIEIPDPHEIECHYLSQSFPEDIIKKFQINIKL